MNDFPKPATPLKAIVFDLDGLMFNTEDIYQDVGREVLRRRDKELTAELLDQMMGRKSDISLQIMIDWHNLNDTVDSLAAESAEVMFELLPKRLAPLPGLIDLLDALEAASIPKAIATSSSREFVIRVLGQFQFEPRFSFVFSSEDITHGKPAPDVYLLATKSLGVDPQQAMVLEDSQIGCRAAIAAGTYAVAVPGGHSHTHDFEGAKFIANSLEDDRIFSALDIPQR